MIHMVDVGHLSAKIKAWVTSTTITQGGQLGVLQWCKGWIGTMAIPHLLSRRWFVICVVIAEQITTVRQSRPGCASSMMTQGGLSGEQVL